jgi:endo-1,4-beta-D-glucanase Y
LYFIAKRISGKKEVGILSVLIYAFSPLGIYYQRRVLLDNIMTFWVFAGIFLITLRKLKLSSVLLSSVFFGFAILSKENAVFFLPLYLYLIYINSEHTNRKFGMILFLTTFVSVVSLYILYAILKKEFFPFGFLGNDEPHVSLLETLSWHATRGESLPFWRRGSDFYGGFGEWMNKDTVMVLLGTASFAIGLVISIFKKEFRAPVLFALLFSIFLIRGGLIIGFYIIPLIPIFALTISQAWQFIIEKLSFGNKLLYAGMLNVSFIAIPALLLMNHNGQYTRNETNPQKEALAWIKQNVPEDSYIVIDNYMYVDLKEPGYINDKVYPNADWFWKIYYDSDIKDKKYDNDFRKIEYLTLSHEMLKQVGVGTQDYLKDTIKNSDEVKRWTQETTSYLDFNNYVSTNGDWMSILKRRSMDDMFLAKSWNNYKRNYIHSYGQVIDPSSGFTTSEGQSYAMLRAVWMADRDTFDGVWAWTRDHLQHRSEDMLVSWLWGKGEEGSGVVLDPNTASDADEDIALALIFASRRFNDQSYMMDAISILRDIWNKEVVEVSGKLLFVSSPSSKFTEGYLINPSYISPASYRIFAEVDKTHDWNKLAVDSYYFLSLISNNNRNQIKLPPNWVIITENGSVISASDYISGDPDYYGYDSFRTFWRVALDKKWFDTKESIAYLKEVEPFLRQQWQDKTKISSVYAMNGTPMTSHSDLSTTSGALSLFSITDDKISREIFESEYSSIVYAKETSGSLNYYNDNWVWFGTALYLNKLPDLWNE